MTQRQKTLAQPVSLQGVGLFTAQPVKVTFHPAPENHGIVFKRTDLHGATVPALVDHVVKRVRRSALRQDQAVVETTEHVLSAIAGCGIDNLLIELDAPELPIFDGSARPFFEKLQQAGIAEQDADRRWLVVEKPVVIRQDDAMIVALPCAEQAMQVIYELDYTALNAAVGRQLHAFDLSPTRYASDIAPARTYSLRPEAEAAQQAGLFSHLSVDQFLVLGDDGQAMGANALRFPDEPVRHKVLDLIGDLYLIGAPIQGRIIAYKSGHPLNQQLARELLKQHRHHRLRHLSKHSSVIDVRRLFRMMPHRYPMLLVDRVIELDGDRRAVGIKNVTINEPFFQGHYPNTPIMPGVLVVEAMAQLSGVLIGQSLEQVGKLPILLSMDSVKLRKPVTPGDQLLLEAEAVRMRSRIAHMRCRAYVAEEIAAEAEVKFMLVDEDQA